MRNTKNTLAPAVRKKVIPTLNQLVADSLGLYTHAKQAHWHVLGANFIALHELFDEVAQAALKATDEMAERVIQLGGEVDGTLKDAAKNTTLPEYPHPKSNQYEPHVNGLLKSLSHLSASTRKAIDSTDEAGDKVTSDILTEITATLDKYVWFVEAHVS